MPFKPGQTGNPNGAPQKSKRFITVLQRAIEQDDCKRMREGIEKLLDQCSEGELSALQFIADRLDGKPKQQTEITGADGEAFKTQVIVRFGNGSE